MRPLLEVVAQRGVYHPTEDVKGVQLAFLKKVSSLVVAQSKDAGLRQSLFTVA